MLLSVAVAVGAAILLRGEEEWMAKIRTDHPRIFFNAEMWPDVQARAAGSAKADFEFLLRRVNRYPSEPVCSGTEAVPMKDYVNPDGSVHSVVHSSIPNVREWGREASECALAWRLTGNSGYLAKAKRMLAVSVAAYAEAYKNHREVNWYSTTRILWLAAYDWIHAGLTPEERRALLVPMVEHVKLAQNHRYPIVRRNGGSGRSDGCYGVSSLQWYAGLAAWRDGICNADAEQLLRAGYRVMMEMCAFRNGGAGDDGGLASATPGYSLGAYPWAHFNFFHSYLSATGENIAARFPGLALHANWLYWMWIQDENPTTPFYCGCGDDQHTQNRLRQGCLHEHLTQYMHFYRQVDPDAAALARGLRARCPSRPLGDVFPFYPFVLSDGEGVAPLSESSLADFPVKARHFEHLGQIVMRSGWKPDSTYAFFTAGATMRSHKHHDENGFVIFKHDFLALDSGSRAVQTDYNLKHYYAQTIAHNCVLIHKPHEPLPSYWGPACPDDAAKWNDGGQYGESARVIAFETNPRYSYVVADAARSYGEKCTEAVRQFVHVQPDVFVVYDRVGASNAAYGKEWLLHTVNEPVVRGRLARADNRRGRLFCETVLPVDARLRTRGGRGQEFWSNGRNWELNRKFVDDWEKRGAKDGRGPYWGGWRLEVAPATPAKDDRFLHVLTATDSAAGVAVKATSVRTETRDGVALTLPGGGEVAVFFNRTGMVGGEIRVNGQTRPFATTIQPQAGVFASSK